KGLAVESLTVCCLFAVEVTAIPTSIADPSLDGLYRFCFVGHQRGFHYRRDEEHERYPSNGGPDHEEWSFHSVVFLLQVPKKCSIKTSLCQPNSVEKVPLNSFIVKRLSRKRPLRRPPPSRSLTRGSVKLAVPTCTQVAPTEM